MPMPAKSVTRRTRWTEEHARGVIAALDRSGKSVRAFAEERGLDPQRIYAWRRRVAQGDGMTFHEVTRAPKRFVTVVSDTSSAFEIALPSGSVLRVPRAFDADALARLLDVLARAHAC